MENYLEIINKRNHEKFSNIMNMLEILPSLDNAHKINILKKCVPFLEMKEVCSKWLELLDVEADNTIKEYMFKSLPPVTESTKELAAKYIDVLLNCFDLKPVFKSKIADYFKELILIESDLSTKIINQYSLEQDKNVKASIVLSLLNIRKINSDLLIFLKSIINEVDEKIKYKILFSLLDQDLLNINEISIHLKGTEPKSIKMLLLRYFEDRGLCPENELKALYKKETNSEIKDYILFLLLTNKNNLSENIIKFVLTELKNETDPEMRNRIYKFIKRTIIINQNNVNLLCKVLINENSIDNVQLLINYIDPYILQFSQIKECFLEILNKSIDLSIAKKIIINLGRHLSGDEELCNNFIKKYNDIVSTEIKFEILASLVKYAYVNENLYEIYFEALKSTNQSIKNQGLIGLLFIPLSDKVFIYFKDSVDILLDNSFDLENRISFAKKIALIPPESSEYREKLNSIFNKISEPEIKKILDKLLEKSKYNSGNENQVDWQLFEKKVKIERKIDYVFPEIYLFFDEKPDKAAELLRLMLIDDQFAAELYQNNIEKIQIINFFIAKNYINLEMTKYAINTLSELNDKQHIREGDNVYILALTNSKHLPEIKDSLWILFEKEIIQNDVELDLGLIRDVFIKAYGDVEFYNEFSKRFISIETYKAVMPYVWFMLKSPIWKHTPKIIEQIIESKSKLSWLDEFIKERHDNQLCKDFINLIESYGKQLLTMDEAIGIKKKQKGFRD